MTTDSLRRPDAGRPIARHARAIVLPAASLLLLLSCHTEQTGPERVATLLVEPASLDLMVNEGVQLHAVPHNEGGAVLAGRVVTWASREPAIATVTSAGTVTGVSIGQTTVFVASEGVAAEVPVTVSAAVGEVDVSVTKLGHAADPVGFQLLIDAQPVEIPIATVSQRLISLPAGAHTATITNINAPCELLGESSRVLFVVARQRVPLTINIACLLDGQLVVTTQTAGQRTTSDPYRVTLDGGVETAIDPNSEVRFALRPRTYQVSLNTLDARCLAYNAIQQAAINEGSTVTVQFLVRCLPDPPSLTGEKLVVSYNSAVGSGLDVMDADGAHRFPLENGPASAGDPALSSDGRRVAYRRFAATGSNLVVLDLTTGIETVSPNALRISGLSWSPDGQRLVTGLWNNGLTSLVVLRVDGSVERSLGLNNVASVSAHWAPDGGTIAITRNNHEVVLVNPDGSNVHALTSSPDRYFDGGVWSADGRTLLVRKYKQYCYYYSWYCYSYEARVVVLDVATGQELRGVSVPDDAFDFVWGATAEEVYFIQAGDVFHARLDNFAPVNVTRSPEEEWSVLWGRFEGGAASVARPRAHVTSRK